MGKFAGKTDMGESAPCSNMGLAQVRKGGVRVTNFGRKYIPCPWRCHPIPGRDWESNFTSPLTKHSPSMCPLQWSLGYAPKQWGRMRPPRRASVGSSGTAEVAKNLVRLFLSSTIHCAGDLLVAGLARRRSLCALASQASEPVARLADAGALSSFRTRSGAFP